MSSTQKKVAVTFAFLAGVWVFFMLNPLATSWLPLWAVEILRASRRRFWPGANTTPRPPRGPE
jgi:hypothetical protein